MWDHCENPQYVVSHSVGQYLYFFLYYFILCTYLNRHSRHFQWAERQPLRTLRRKCHMLLSRNLFDLLLIYLLHTEQLPCRFCCLLDSLRPINNLSVMWGRVVLGWTSTKLGFMCLAYGHNAATLVKLEPVAPPSRVKLSTTEPLRSPDYTVTARKTGPAKCPRGCRSI